MGATVKADWGFEPKVWQDHIDEYRDKKLVFGAFAEKDYTLTAAPGETINFPFFKSIGDAEEPAENESLSVDRLQDDSFSATVKEVGKAVGFKKKAIRTSAARKERVYANVQDQIARAHAEKIDADLIAEINGSGNHVDGFVATGTSNVANIVNIATGKIQAFGDKHNQAVAIFLHSYHVLSLLTDSTSGFLKGDALSPWYAVPGFQGTLLGMAVIECDQVPRGVDISSKQSYYAFMIKPMAYGICQAEAYDMEDDYDMLAREYVVAATQWYAVKSFHGKRAANDYRISRHLFCTSIAA